MVEPHEELKEFTLRDYLMEVLTESLRSLLERTHYTVEVIATKDNGFGVVSLKRELGASHIPGDISLASFNLRKGAYRVSPLAHHQESVRTLYDSSIPVIDDVFSGQEFYRQT